MGGLGGCSLVQSQRTKGTSTTIPAPENSHSLFLTIQAQQLRKDGWKVSGCIHSSLSQVESGVVSHFSSLVGWAVSTNSATGYRLPATGYRLPATGYRLPATKRKRRIAQIYANPCVRIRVIRRFFLTLPTGNVHRILRATVRLGGHGLPCGFRFPSCLFRCRMSRSRSKTTRGSGRGVILDAEPPIRKFTVSTG